MIKNKFQKSNTGLKYKNVKKEVDGIMFDSTAEAEYYIRLRAMERAGQIKFIKAHPSVHMTAARILYKPDFLIEEKGRKVYIDVKGVVTPEFALKRRLWRYYGDGVLRVVTKEKFEFDKADEITTIVGDFV